MENMRSPTFIFLIFILLIILITCFYNENISIINSNYSKEGFNNVPTTIPNPMPTIASDPSNLAIDNIDIKDLSGKKTATQNLYTLKQILDRFTTLDSPISINNKGNICSEWGEYDNSKYQFNNNSCLVIPESGSKDRQCLSNNILTSCSIYYDDKTINNNIKFNTKQILDITIQKIISGSASIIANIDKKSSDIDQILSNLIAKLTLENQQIYFIKYNDGNLDDKKKILDKESEEIEKTENEININKINFNQFVAINNDYDNKINIYYKIIVGLIIAIVIVGIFYFLFSKTM